MQKNNPFFSIIIPTYNRSGKLRRTLESVERQTFRDHETIVCDDGSTDNTSEVVDSFFEKMPMTYLREENWGGPARPRNNGLRAARGEWICFLDADDWWYPDKLERVYETISHADVVHHDGDIYASAGKKLLVKMRSRTLKTPVFVDMMTQGNPVITSGVCVRKVVIEKAGEFSEDKALISVEDFDLWLKISLITERFVHIPRMLCGYWSGDGNISRSPQYISAHIALFDKFRKHLMPADEQESKKYFAYCIGTAQMNTDLYKECRKQFTMSLKSRNTHIVAMSLARIVESFVRQAANSIKS